LESFSQVGGYYDNPEIKIPLPGAIEKADKLLRMARYGPELDSFEMSMNQAAERS
jgi:hypothetical protein